MEDVVKESDWNLHFGGETASLLKQALGMNIAEESCKKTHLEEP